MLNSGSPSPGSIALGALLSRPRPLPPRRPARARRSPVLAAGCPDAVRRRRRGPAQSDPERDRERGAGEGPPAALRRQPYARAEPGGDGHPGSRRRASASGSQAISPATLTVMAGNERILAHPARADWLEPAVRRAARARASDQPGADGLRAVDPVPRPGLRRLGRLARHPLLQGFSPAGTLAHTAALAATNSLFGQARDTLWKQASNESVFDSTQTLLGENPALQNACDQRARGHAERRTGASTRPSGSSRA